MTANHDIVDKARAWIAACFEGNGLKSEQIRLKQHKTSLHDIPAEVTVTLVPDFRLTSAPGRSPQGETVASKQDAAIKIAAFAGAALSSSSIASDIRTTLDADTSRGWGMGALRIPLAQTKKEFFCIEPCPQCSGRNFVPCVDCKSTGNIPCPFCYNTGVYQQGSGQRLPCIRCNAQGHTPCLRCNGQKQIACASCRRQGVWTHAWKGQCLAEFHFSPLRAQAEPEIWAIAEMLGFQTLATEGHALLKIGDPVLQGQTLHVPVTASLPVTQAEFLIEGKAKTATLAGWKGRVVKIDPLLDPYIKPGINALLKLSKGPMAALALMTTACKCRLVRNALIAAAAHSRKAAYNEIKQEYALIVSDKYARATAQHAGNLIQIVSARPKRLGLMLGLLVSSLMAGTYYFMDGRLQAGALLKARGMERFIVGVDFSVWAASLAISIIIIRVLASTTMKKILPPEILAGKRASVSAGLYALYALGATLIVFLAISAVSPVKPEWMLPALKHIGIVRAE